MKITIDTKEDSHQEIRKIISMLSSLVGDKEIVSNQGNIFENNSIQEEINQEPSQEQTGGVFNMFGDDSVAKKEEDISASEILEEDTSKSEEENAELTIEPKEMKETKEEPDLGIPKMEEYDD